MSSYMTRLFPKSNSSFLLSSGNALKSQVLRLREKMYLVDSGIGSPRMCMQDELTSVPQNKSAVRFENKVEFVDSVARETLIRRKNLERLFVDIVAGEQAIKDQSTARFNDMVGSSEVVPGEAQLLLPRRFRQKLAWKELNRCWRTNTPVRGFVLDKVRGGYSVAIAGFVTFLPLRRHKKRSKSSDRYIIERINPQKTNVVVL